MQVSDGVRKCDPRSLKIKKYISHYELFCLDQAELRVPARDQRLQLSK